MKPNPTQITRRSLLKSAGAIAIGLSLPSGVEALAEKARESLFRQIPPKRLFHKLTCCRA